MKLTPNLEGRTILVKDVDGKTFRGTVGDYIHPEDNEPEGESSIVLDISDRKNPVEFRESEITSIKIIS